MSRDDDGSSAAGTAVRSTAIRLAAALVAIGLTVTASGCTDARPDAATPSPSALPPPTVTTPSDPAQVQDGGDRPDRAAPAADRGPVVVGGPRASCADLREATTSLLAAAGLGALRSRRPVEGGCAITAERGLLRVLVVGPVDPVAYLSATGLASAETAVRPAPTTIRGVEVGQLVTAVTAGTAAAAASLDGVAVVIRIQGTVDPRDADQAAAVLELVAATIAGDG